MGELEFVWSSRVVALMMSLTHLEFELTWPWMINWSSIDRSCRAERLIGLAVNLNQFLKWHSTKADTFAVFLFRLVEFISLSAGSPFGLNWSHMCWLSFFCLYWNPNWDEIKSIKCVLNIFLQPYNVTSMWSGGWRKLRQRDPNSHQTCLLSEVNKKQSEAIKKFTEN